MPKDNITSVPTDGKKRRIGVMTSGGDAPGMNAAVRAVARMALAKGCEPFAIREGYEGLVQGGELIKKMSWEDVRGYLSEVYPLFFNANIRVEHSLVLLAVLPSANDLVVSLLLSILSKPALTL
jgi:hypothetical protein